MSTQMVEKGVGTLAPGDGLVVCYFSVTLDHQSLGEWTDVELGGVSVAVEQVEEGGNQGFAYQLPGRLQFQPIKLTRVMDSSTSQVAEWFSGMTGAIKRSTGQIVAYNTLSKPVLSWSFIEAIPVRWTLPTLSAKDASSAATESLEIAHQGFVKV
ncbi:MAG: phage tail protein [Acidimicrobiales bacterium]